MGNFAPCLRVHHGRQSNSLSFCSWQFVRERVTMSSDDTTGKQPKTEEEPREDDYDDDDSAFEQQKALVSKRKAVPKRRQKAKPATMVCLPCRTSKLVKLDNNLFDLPL